MTRRMGSTLAWAPLAIAAVVAAALMGTAFLIQRSIQESSLLVARGIGEAFGIAGWQSLGGDAYPPQQETLDRFLEQHSEAGLRYVGVYAPDGTTPLAEAGVEEGSSMSEGVTLLTDRARLVGRVRARRPEGRPPPPGEERRGRPFPRVVYEFEPLAALELQNRASGLLIVAAIFSLGALGIAGALSMMLRQRERLQDELERGKRLAALGSMSAVLAHELRNPLASAKGHAQLLAESVETDPRLHPKAELVVSEVVRVERLMNDLLAFVKSGELRRTRVEPLAVLESAIATTGAGGRIELRNGGARPAMLDSARLQQALENVLRNALEASPAQSPVVAQVSDEGRSTLFAIHDSGAGIPAGEESRIFEPFVTGRIQGVGLGLAITRRIAELHGGTVTARNRPEGGAVFELRIPREVA